MASEDRTLSDTIMDVFLYVWLIGFIALTIWNL
jgi:hypothetical protein